MLRARLPEAGYALAGSITLQVAFLLFKGEIPAMVSFHADAALAAFDAWLHGGQDAWRLLHDGAVTPPAQWAARIYTVYWTYPALFFPLLLVLTDADPARRRRYLLLYAGSWVFLGNLLALAGASVGAGLSRCAWRRRTAGLAGALGASGIADTSVGTIQAMLWAGVPARRASAWARRYQPFPACTLPLPRFSGRTWRNAAAG